MLFRLNNTLSARTFGAETTATTITAGPGEAEAKAEKKQRRTDETAIEQRRRGHDDGNEERFLMCLNIHPAHRGR